jgi:hypothetical protein
MGSGKLRLFNINSLSKQLLGYINFENINQLFISMYNNINFPNTKALFGLFFLFKGTVPRDFNPAVIFIKQFPWYPHSGVEALAPKAGAQNGCFNEKTEGP